MSIKLARADEIDLSVAKDASASVLVATNGGTLTHLLWPAGVEATTVKALIKGAMDAGDTAVVIADSAGVSVFVPFVASKWAAVSDIHALLGFPFISIVLVDAAGEAVVQAAAKRTIVGKIAKIREL